jgi:PAS domain S-box-containing protein
MRALLTALLVCVVLIFILLGVWSFAPIPDAYYRDAFFMTALFSIALVSVGVYQAFRLYDHVQALALGMTKDLLTDSKELFFELYQRSPVPYAMIDAEGIVESVNYSMARLFNMEIGAFQGISIFEFLQEDETHKLEFAPEYFAQGKFINDIEVCLKRPDGMNRWVMLSLYSFNDARAVRKGLLTLVDISKQKQVDKAKSEFVSLASHQLRSPIAAMRWNIELLQTAGKGKMDETQTAYIEKIAHGLSRMDMLVNDFLNVSKFELGTLTAKVEPLDLIPFLGTIQEEQDSFVEKKGLHMETEWDEALGTVHTDSHLLHMIVSNLLSNAIKYTPTGGTVYHSVIDDGTHFIIRISDTGIGIPLNEHDQIFSKVFRASNTQDLAVEGTGLGLYIVKEAAQVLGGTISFESVEGEGTTFTVVLPK